MNKKIFLLYLSVIAFSSSAVAEYCEVGTEQWVEGCAVRCEHSWDGNNCPQVCTATAPAGFVIMNHRDNNISENHGSYSISGIASGQNFDFKRTVQQAYSDALDIAAKANNKEATAKITQDMKSAIAEAESFNSSHQMVRLSVDATKHGSQFDRKRGWSEHKVDLLVKCVVPANLEEQLMKKYALQ